MIALFPALGVGADVFHVFLAWQQLSQLSHHAAQLVSIHVRETRNVFHRIILLDQHVGHVFGGAADVTPLMFTSCCFLEPTAHLPPGNAVGTLRALSFSGATFKSKARHLTMWTTRC